MANLNEKIGENISVAIGNLNSAQILHMYNKNIITMQ